MSDQQGPLAGPLDGQVNGAPPVAPAPPAAPPHLPARRPRARAEFYVAKRDRRKRRVRCERPVGVFDYPDGRVITSRTDRARESFVSFLPGSPPEFVRAMTELRASIAA